MIDTILIVIHLMIVLALIVVVLLQRSEGGALGIGGGGGGLMTARGAANALTRTTAILATGFFVTSLALGLTARYGARPTDVLDRIPATQSAPAGNTGGNDGTSGNLLDQLGGAPTSGGVPAGGSVETPAGTPATADPAIAPSQNTTTGPTMDTPNQPVGGVPAGGSTAAPQSGSASPAPAAQNGQTTTVPPAATMVSPGDGAPAVQVPAGSAEPPTGSSQPATGNAPAQ